MKVTQAHLKEAVEHEIISAEQSTALLQFLRNRPGAETTFNVTHIVYYFGGLVAISAMGMFLNLGWETFGGWGIFFISLLYAGIGLYMSQQFRVRAHVVPAGICATFVVTLTPLGIYGLQSALGWWPSETPHWGSQIAASHWLLIELGTLVVGIAMARQMRYPFMLMPVAAALWCLSMDVASMLSEGAPDWQFQAWVSVGFGLLMLLAAFWVDLRAHHAGDYAFWLYLFGLMAFWGGLTCQDSSSELSNFLYFCVNLLLIGFGAVWVRRAFVIFGGLGSALYLAHLASVVFADSWFFPITLSVIGLSIVLLGTAWQRHEDAITHRLQALLPLQLRELLQARLNA